MGLFTMWYFLLNLIFSNKTCLYGFAPPGVRGWSALILMYFGNGWWARLHIHSSQQFRRKVQSQQLLTLFRHQRENKVIHRHEAPASPALMVSLLPVIRCLSSPSTCALDPSLASLRASFQQDSRSPAASNCPAFLGHSYQHTKQALNTKLFTRFAPSWSHLYSSSLLPPSLFQHYHHVYLIPL